MLIIAHHPPVVIGAVQTKMSRIRSGW